MSATYPEDSVLRRHAMAAEQMMGSPGVGHPPTDSVLLRHYRQLIDSLSASEPASYRAQTTAKATVEPKPAAATARPAVQAAPAASVPAATTPPSGGLIGFFKRLLGF
ncbi:hypothetical protein [Sedimenticola thiotaurini]|uniref:hypothetical protein n=1 Tax=Sedimenticola thiotaurini TaxID=1543721 RepID=UPI000AEF6AB8|nr:hypothetical protein [Sedimenticola thiotaurini]